MTTTLCEFVAMFLSGLPFLAILFLLFHYAWRRTVWRRRRRRGGKSPGFCPPAAALAAALLLVPVLFRPSLIHTLKARQQAQVEEDDQGDPGSPDAELDRQLRQIRRGEPVEGLVLRTSGKGR